MSGKVIQMFTMVGRNDPCPCGSGKKYKKCCLSKHEEEELLRQRMESEEILSERYFSVKEYISETGFPLNYLDFFLIEILNITGGNMNKIGKPSEEQSKEVLKKIMKEARNFFTTCRKCKLGCLKEPYKKSDLKSLKDKGLKLDEFPEALQRPTNINLFYFEFLNIVITALSDEIEPLMSEDEAADIVSSVHDSIFGFIADSCWENCNNKCVKEHEKNAYCNFCSFSEAGLPCPRSGDVSYKEIHATEKDMLH